MRSSDTGEWLQKYKYSREGLPEEYWVTWEEEVPPYLHTYFWGKSEIIQPPTKKFRQSGTLQYVKALKEVTVEGSLEGKPVRCIGNRKNIQITLKIPKYLEALLNKASLQEEEYE